MAKMIIAFDLSERDVGKAINDLNKYKQSIEEKTKLLQARVAERLADEARQGFSGAIVDDMVSDGTRYAKVKVSVNDRGDITAVIAEGEDAVWVEFGAGVYHNGSPGASPHPHGAELGFLIGSYGKGNGKRKVWGWYEDGKLKLSRGTPAVMPMSRAVTTVINELPEIAKEVFG